MLKIGDRLRGVLRPDTDAGLRPPRSCSRRRTGGAASAVLLIVLGAGTLGAFPPAHPRGNAIGTVVTPAAMLVAPSFELPGIATVTAGPLPVDADGAASAQEQRPAQFTTALPDQRAQVAIRTAMSQIGLPYVWGGNGPTHGDAGFDCSGLTTFSYAAARVALPRTAHTQYYKGPHVPTGAALQPGDLVFYGTPATVHHVGMYLGGGKMVNAPTFGKPVQVAFYRYGGDDYLGATRPAATGHTSTGLLPYAPEEPSTGAPPAFPAPVAPAPTAVPDVTAPQPSEAVSAAEASAAATPSVVPTTTPTSSTPPTSSPVPTTTPERVTTTTRAPVPPSTTTPPPEVTPTEEPTTTTQETTAGTTTSPPVVDPPRIPTLPFPNGGDGDQP